MLLVALTVNLTDLIRTSVAILHYYSRLKLYVLNSLGRKNASVDYIRKRPHYSVQAMFPAVKIERQTSVSLISSWVNSTILQEKPDCCTSSHRMTNCQMGWKTRYLRILSCKNELWNACCKTLKCCLDSQTIWLNSEQIVSATDQIFILHQANSTLI